MTRKQGFEASDLGEGLSGAPKPVDRVTGSVLEEVEETDRPIWLDLRFSLEDMLKQTNLVIGPELAHALEARRIPDVPEGGQREARIFLAPINLTVEEITTLMEQEGYRPATAKELVAFAEAHPEGLKDIEAIALGTRLPPSEGAQPQIPQVLHIYEFINDGLVADLVYERSREKVLWPDAARFLGVKRQAT